MEGAEANCQIGRGSNEGIFRSALARTAPNGKGSRTELRRSKLITLFRRISGLPRVRFVLAVYTELNDPSFDSPLESIRSRIRVSPPY